MKVAYTSQFETVKTCREVGKISASKGFRFGSPGLSDRDRIMNALRNKTADMGGNVVLTKSQETKHYDIVLGDDPSMNGRAYDCPADVYAKLGDFSDL